MSISIKSNESKLKNKKLLINITWIPHLTLYPSATKLSPQVRSAHLNSDPKAVASQSRATLAVESLHFCRFWERNFRKRFGSKNQSRIGRIWAGKVSICWNDIIRSRPGGVSLSRSMPYLPGSKRWKKPAWDIRTSSWFLKEVF